MSDPERSQGKASNDLSARGKVLWFGRRGTLMNPAETQAAVARKRFTNLFELLFTLVFFDLAALVMALSEFLFKGPTAAGIACAFLVVTLSALADWIFILMRRELRKRREQRRPKIAAEEQL